MTNVTWNIIDRGDVPIGEAPVIEYDCPRCGAPALLPVRGLALAQVGDGVVFEPGVRAMPKIIRCRECRRDFALA